MTEYELADYAVSVMSNFLAAITIYFSIVTAYVMAAFIAGKRLSMLQLTIVNAAFTIAAGIMGSLAYLLFRRFFELARLTNKSSNETPLIDFSLPLGILALAIYLGCLLFMWTVRRKPELD